MITRRVRSTIYYRVELSPPNVEKTRTRVMKHATFLIDKGLLLKTMISTTDVRRSDVYCCTYIEVVIKPPTTNHRHAVPDDVDCSAR